VSATITVGIGASRGFDGLDHIVTSTPSQDQLSLSWDNSNGIDVIGGVFLRNGQRSFEGLVTRNESWWGVHVERYACDDPGRGAYVFWSVRNGSVLELRQWSPILSLRAHTLPTTGARGVTRSSRGHFYVVDAPNRRILHLAPDGSLVDSFPTPGRDPADLSYGE
jgi:hypothetical protein